MTNEEASNIPVHLNALLAAAGLEPLDEAVAARFGRFYDLLVQWNARINLTAIRDEEGILSLHFVESIACARALPAGIGTLLDFGSGAGFPGIPIALCRPEISVTLAESQGKKAAFLHEAVRRLGIGARVHAGRAESLAERFDCVTLRAVDRMTSAVKAAAPLVASDGALAALTTLAEFENLQALPPAEFKWQTLIPLLKESNRVLALATRAVRSEA